MTSKPSPTALRRPATRAAVHPPSRAPARYHPALVALHWTLALLLGLALAMGTLVLAEMPNAASDKIGALRGHMIMGMAIGALMLVRLLVRWRTSTPPAASSGHAMLDLLRRWTHAGLYLLVFAMAASGLATALGAGLPQIVFGNATASLPVNFLGYPARLAHGWLATALIVLIAMHLFGALFHQFSLKDRLLSRMWFASLAAARHSTRSTP